MDVILLAAGDDVERGATANPIAPACNRAHIAVMAQVQTKPVRKTPMRRSDKLMYRGIELPRLTAPSRLPLAEIKRAVADAFAKHAASIAED